MLTRRGHGWMAAGIVLSALITPSLAASVSACPAPPLRGDAMGKIDDALQARLEAGAAGTVPVIVTFTAPSTIASSRLAGSTSRTVSMRSAPSPGP